MHLHHHDITGHTLLLRVGILYAYALIIITLLLMHLYDYTRLLLLLSTTRL